MDGLPLFEASRATDTRKPQKPEEPRCLSVSELTALIRGELEGSFQEVWVQGEISNLRPAASGHLYFSLKDSGASLAAAIFGWGRQRASKRIRFDVEDGMEVVCRGRISVYPPRGSYQLLVDQIEPLGAGALQIAFEQLKERLEREGLFAPARKRSLPLYPSRVAVVTSPSGAAIQDILNVMGRRASFVQVIVVPALVQGDGAAAQLIRGLERVNRENLADVVVLARGGGSMEDLWCFNDEGLARSIASSRIPVVSAVGHEIDFTISDFVADLRAPTPSAAAEIVTAAWVDARERVRGLGERLQSWVRRDLQHRRRLLEQMGARLKSPKDRLRDQSQRCDELGVRLERAMGARLERQKSVILRAAAQLDALSPLRVLSRGYSLVRDPGNGGTLVKSVRDVRSGQTLEVVFSDGSIPVQTLQR